MEDSTNYLARPPTAPLGGPPITPRAARSASHNPGVCGGPTAPDTPRTVLRRGLDGKGREARWVRMAPAQPLSCSPSPARAAPRAGGPGGAARSVGRRVWEPVLPGAARLCARVAAPRPRPLPQLSGQLCDGLQPFGDGAPPPPLRPGMQMEPAARGPGRSRALGLGTAWGSAQIQWHCCGRLRLPVLA